MFQCGMLERCAGRHNDPGQLSARHAVHEGPREDDSVRDPTQVRPGSLERGLSQAQHLYSEL